MEDIWSFILILFWNFFYFFLGGWYGRGIFKVIFNSGGVIEFVEYFRVVVVSGELINYIGF